MHVSSASFLIELDEGTMEGAGRREGGLESRPSPASQPSVRS